MEIQPQHKFEDILSKIRKLIVVLQRRFPSIAVRVLFANSLLSSCLWFYAYFPPLLRSSYSGLTPKYGL